MKVTYPKVGNMSRWLDHSTSLIMRVEEALSSETGRTTHSWHGPSQTKVSDVSHACQWKPSLHCPQTNVRNCRPEKVGEKVVFCLESEILCDCIESDTGVPAGISSVLIDCINWWKNKDAFRVFLWKREEVEATLWFG